jgi:hypothetical protein
MSELVESALRVALRNQKKAIRKVTLPSFRGGKSRVDVSNRDLLYERLDDR